MEGDTTGSGRMDPLGLRYTDGPKVGRGGGGCGASWRHGPALVRRNAVGGVIRHLEVKNVLVVIL